MNQVYKTFLEKNVIKQKYNERVANYGIVDPIARTLNGISIYIFIFLLAASIYEGYYIPLVVLLLTAALLFIWPFSISGLIIFSIFYNNWVFVYLLSTFFLLRCLIILFEKKSVERHLNESEFMYISSNLLTKKICH